MIVARLAPAERRMNANVYQSSHERGNAMCTLFKSSGSVQADLFATCWWAMESQFHAFQRSCTRLRKFVVVRSEFLASVRSRTEAAPASQASQVGGIDVIEIGRAHV